MVPPSISVVSLYPMVVPDFLDHWVCDRSMMFCPFDKLSLIRSFCPICVHCLMAIFVGLSSYQQLHPASDHFILSPHAYLCVSICLFFIYGFMFHHHHHFVHISMTSSYIPIKILNFNCCEKFYVPFWLVCELAQELLF